MRNKVKLVILLILTIVILGWIFRKNLKLPPIAYGKAKLTWESGNDENIKGYKVYYGTKPRIADCPPGGYENILDVSGNKNYEIESLRNRETYYFSVTSYNDSGTESCFSEEMKKTVNLSVKEIIDAFLK